MKKVLISCVMCIFALLLCSRSVLATEITDTGGGDVTTITTEATSEASTELATPSVDSETEKQMSDIINQDYIPDVKAEDFFDKITGKLAESMTFAQEVVAWILGIMFVVALITLAASALGSHKERIIPCAIGLLVIALAFVGDIYVMDILGAFSNWAGN